MRNRRFDRTHLFVSLLLAGALFLAGCFSRPKEPSSPGELLILGQEDLKAERFESAREAFKRLLREYPDSKHRRDALLNLADTYYKAGEYIEAKVQYSEYVQLYPISPLTAKAYYFLGMSDYNRMLDYDQDQATTRDALESFQTLVKRFPRSDHAADSKEKIRELREHIAKHELFVARFYTNKGLRVSAIPRLREIVRSYRDAPQVRAEAMYYLGEGYRLEESYRKAGQAYRDLIAEYPASPFAQDAYDRLLELAEGDQKFAFRDLPSRIADLFADAWSGVWRLIGLEGALGQ